jgi:tetratricopeptide (TPR) repeat protein
VRAETRHQLKQDRFSRTTIDVAEKTVHWSAEHKTRLIAAGAVLVVIVAAAGAIWYYLNQQNQKASIDLTQAMRTLDTPVRPPNMPAQPDVPSFASSQERAKAAQKQFQAIVDKYPHTRGAEFARYFLGSTSVSLGDTAAAEKDYKAVVSSGNADLAALAKLALAGVYRDSGRTKDAIELYKQLAAKPTVAVGKVMAEMEMASTYEAANQPLEAKRIYEQIQKENPASQAAQLVAEKLRQLK